MLPDAAPGAGGGGPALPAAAAAFPVPAFIVEVPPAELSRGVAGGGLGAVGATATPCAAVAPEPVVGPDCAAAAPARVTRTNAGTAPGTSLRTVPLRAGRRRGGVLLLVDAIRVVDGHVAGRAGLALAAGTVRAAADTAGPCRGPLVAGGAGAVGLAATGEAAH